jgi:hypothetical protein
MSKKFKGMYGSALNTARAEFKVLPTPIHAERFIMTPGLDYSAAANLSSRALSAEEQEREDYLNEVSQQSTQFGCGTWQYESGFNQVED